MHADKRIVNLVTHIPCFRLCHAIHFQIEKASQQILIPIDIIILIDVLVEVILDTIILSSLNWFNFTAKDILLKYK